jgi:membrane dipeptidase
MTSDPLILVDAHEDIAFNTVNFGRNFVLSARQKRRLESKAAFLGDSGIATTGLPDALLGRVGVIFGTLFAQPCAVQLMGGGDCYDNAANAYKMALAQWDVYQRLADENDRIRLIRSCAELDAVLATWREGVPFADHKVGIVLSLEGADPILEPKQFEEWYERGVRAVGLAWLHQGRYVGGNREPGRLTRLGHELLDILTHFHTILDISHMPDMAVQEVLDSFAGTLIASHSNPRHFCESERHLPDTTIRRLAERGGVIGAVPYNAFLSTGWSKNDPKSGTPFDRYVAVIDHICQVTGAAQYVGIGSDLDGGFGVEHTPVGLDTVTDLYQLRAALQSKGYAESDIQAILGGNFLRILRTILPR